MVADLDLPDPFEIEGFVGSLATKRGRRIELMPVAANPDLPCGLVLTTRDADLIVYRADTTPLHREHILLHEAAHILCGHDDSAAGEGAFASAAQALMPHLSPDLVRSVLGRTVYSEPDEHEAELVASLIRQRVERRGRAGASGSARLDAVLGISEA
jgi:hypothetical protein